MNELLKNLTSELTFRPENGVFRSKLAEMVIADASEEAVELFSERSCDIQVTVSRQTIEEGTIRFLVVSDLGEQILACDFSDMDHDELSDFDEQITRQLALHPESLSSGPSEVIVRKDFNGMLDIHQAAQKLGCTQKLLKSKVPCTDYSYTEIDGKKEIQEYFWSQELIGRLCDLKLNGTKAEDVKFIADECCHGDAKWAEDLIRSIDGSASSHKPV